MCCRSNYLAMHLSCALPCPCSFVHVCSQSCTFLEPDPSSDMHVCTITGRCFAAMLTEREEHAGEWERGRSRGGQGGEEGEEAGEEAVDEGFSGRLGRAFAAGEGQSVPRRIFRTADGGNVCRQESPRRARFCRERNPASIDDHGEDLDPCRGEHRGAFAV